MTSSFRFLFWCMLAHARAWINMRSNAEAAASGHRWAWRAAIVIVLCPAKVWISLLETPAIASKEQNICWLQCHVYTLIPASLMTGSNQNRP
jgi:hypothetical protein